MLRPSGAARKERPMAHDRPLRILQPLGGTRLACRPSPGGDHQDLLVEATPLGAHLARLLAALAAGPEPGTERLQGRPFYLVPHSPSLDEGLAALVDTLIEMRIAHPRLVQLELEGLTLGDLEKLVLGDTCPERSRRGEGLDATDAGAAP
jgi:hypothetical protein